MSGACSSLSDDFGWALGWTLLIASRLLEIRGRIEMVSFLSDEAIKQGGEKAEAVRPLIT